jgi:RNA polymerase sigma factor (sigma-70 family)
LRVQLAAQHPESSVEEVEDAVQYACKSFLDEAQGITDPGKVYAWIRTAAHRALNRTTQHRVRELAVDPLGGGLDESASEDPTPEEDLIAQEEKGEIATLVREVVADLPKRHRQVLALHVAGLKRPEIASRLRLPERAVKRDLLEDLVLVKEDQDQPHLGLEQGTRGHNRRERSLCAGLLAECEALWTFCEVDGVEPTNNVAERAIRPAVIMRKVQLGTQSENGNRWIERILSVRETCRLQERSTIAYLIEAASAAHHGKPAPSLVPP